MNSLFKNLMIETLRGKTVWRILFNFELKKFRVGGEILDIGAGNERSSYFRFLQLAPEHKITTVDITDERKPDIVADLEKGFPVGDNKFDYVTCFNLLEHIYGHQKAVNECFRVLKSGGILLGAAPFIMHYHPDPNDYFRYTSPALEKIFQTAGFSDIKIKPLGYGPFIAGFSQIEYLIPGCLKIFIIPLLILVDKIIIKIRPHYGRSYILGYLFEAKK